MLGIIIGALALIGIIVAVVCCVTKNPRKSSWFLWCNVLDNSDCSNYRCGGIGCYRTFLRVNI